MTTFSFLFGKEAAYKIRLLEKGLLDLDRKHSAYFATIPSQFTLAKGETRPARLVEFARPLWQAGKPSLIIDPTLPTHLIADCFILVQQVSIAPLPARPARKWRLFYLLRALPFGHPLLKSHPKALASFRVRLFHLFQQSTPHPAETTRVKRQAF